jgi:hypothetical protein
VALNTIKQIGVCILFIVGQKQKCRVFSYPTRSLSWFPRFSSFIILSETTMSCGGDIGCIVESGFKHQQANWFCLFVVYRYFAGMICSLQKQHSSLRSDSTPNITTT